MKLLVIGLGSMGKRRVRDLLALKAGDIFGFDFRADRCAEVEDRFGVRTYVDFDAAMAQDPTAVVISLPPELHIEYAMRAARANKHFFTEVNVVNDGLPELMRVCAEKAIVAAPSATFRFHPAARKIKEVLAAGELGRPLSFAYHFGQYLPYWHPWEDYRQFYAGRRMTSGSREMLAFVLIWLTWLLGDVAAVSAFKDKLSDLDADVDDVYQVILRFRSGVLGSFMSDIVSHIPYRTFRLMAEGGVVEWEWNAGEVRIFTTKDSKWQIIPDGHGFRGFSSEQIYLPEIEAFLKAVRGEAEWPHSLQDDARVLDCVYAADRSAVEGRHIVLPERALG